MEAFVLFMAAIFGIGLGICLVRIGSQRRVGSAPHCLKCNYPIMGISGATCPECGAVLNLRTIAQGEHRPMRSVVLMGWIFAAVGVVSIYPITQMDWYHVKPIFLLVRDLRHPEKRGQAAQELRKRLERDAFSRRQQNAAADQFVTNLVGWRSGGRIYHDELVCIGRMMSADSFTSSQLADLTARLTVMQCRYIPGQDCLRVSGDTMIPGLTTPLGLVPRYSVDVLSVDGKEADQRVFEVVLPRAFDPELMTGGISWGFYSFPDQTIRVEKDITLRVTATWYDFRSHMTELRSYRLNTKISLYSRDDVRSFEMMIHQLRPDTVSRIQSDLTLCAADNWAKVDVRLPMCP